MLELKMKELNSIIYLHGENSETAESEAYILGIMINDLEERAKIGAILEPSYFSCEENILLFNGIKKAKDTGTISVHQALSDKGHSKKTGGIQYLVDLSSLAQTGASTEAHLEVLVKAHLISSLTNIVKHSNSSKTIISAIEDLQQKFTKKSSYLDDSKDKLLKPVDLEKIFKQAENSYLGLKTGIILSNEEELELPCSSLSFIAGATSHGKTMLLVNLAIKSLEHNPDKVVYFFSYEESEEDILARFVNCYVARGLSKNNFRSIKAFFANGNTDFIKESEQETFLELYKEFKARFLDTNRLYFSYENLSAEVLCDHICHIRKNRKGVGGIFIDYMQLIYSEKGSDSRFNELKYMCGLFKDCAVKTSYPMIFGCQFNRKVLAEEHLISQNIGEGGDIERIASLVLGIWNRGMNPEDCKKDELLIKILKGRNIGAGQRCVMQFYGNQGRVDKLTSIKDLMPF